MDQEKKDQEYNIHLSQDRETSKNPDHNDHEVFHHEEDEIDLRDYIEVLWRRKWSIFIIFLISVVVAGVISFIIPPTYQAKNLVELGSIKDKPLQTPSEISAVLKKDVVLDKIKEKLEQPLELSGDINNKTVSNMFSVNKLEENGEAKFIEISGYAQTPENAVLVVKKVTDVLLEYHGLIFEEAEKTYNIELASIENSKEKAKKDIERIQKDITRLEQDITEYTQKIEEREDIQSEGQGRIAESYINLLAEVKDQKDNKEAQLLNLEQKLVNLDQALQQKKYERVYQTKNTQVELEATPPDQKIAPKRKQNVLIAGVLGIFIGIFYAFGVEYFKRA